MLLRVRTVRGLVKHQISAETVFNVAGRLKKNGRTAMLLHPPPSLRPVAASLLEFKVFMDKGEIPLF